MLKWCLEYWLSSVCPLYSSSSTRLVKVTAFSNLPGSAVCMNIKASHCLDYQEGVCVCVCVPEQSLKWICSASGQFRVGLSFFNSELSSLLSCNKTWFCFRTLHWISYKYKHKKASKSKPHISTGFHHWFLHATCYLTANSHWFAMQMLRQLCVHHLNLTKAGQICDRSVYSPVLQSLFVLCWVSVLHWSSLHAKPLVRLCEVQRLPEIMDVNRTTQMWHEQNHTRASPPLRESLCSVTVFHVQL